MDNGQLVVRIPFRVAGPNRLATNSEVATMAYCTRPSSPSLHRFLAWCDDLNNPTGTKYIIMSS
ncbi:hypothetical protein GQ43DRAFT_381526 [Delitschia confertaspora ATCC 74209]|uniref:Uncharacterized protein n=1 Tax=Delitschia confertaspora ATCC 74209 TaxID=1513339 RepID=A0A9P4JHD0_9PLEO|nr:hypothetical protein GQ43DRAFT_381526 [Delitschia confertaspora ATCC 74209]